MNRQISKHALVGLSLILLSWGILGVVLSGHGFNGVESMTQDLSPSMSTASVSPEIEALSIWIGSATSIENISIGVKFISWNSGGTNIAWSNSLFTAIDIGCFIIALGTVSVERREDRRLQKLRERILSEVESNPGIHLRELHRIIGCAMGALQYHLRILEEDGQVISLRNGNVRHIFTPDYSSDEKVMLLTALARNPTIGSILSECAANGQTTQAVISRSLDVDKSLISYYISSLLDADILRSVKVFGREKPVLLTDWARATIDCHGLLVQ
ncbi:MAG: winged helix-turn-helix transcriptional regulator [Candidatus Thorarchaeota archaeon]